MRKDIKQENRKKADVVSIGNPGIDSKQISKRTLLKKAALGGLAVATTAGLAKKALTLAIEKDTHNIRLGEYSTGEEQLKARRYVAMTKDEKGELIKFLKSNYKKKR